MCGSCRPDRWVQSKPSHGATCRNTTSTAIAVVDLERAVSAGAASRDRSTASGWVHIAVRPSASAANIGRRAIGPRVGLEVDPIERKRHAGVRKQPRRGDARELVAGRELSLQTRAATARLEGVALVAAQLGAPIAQTATEVRGPLAFGLTKYRPSSLISVSAAPPEDKYEPDPLVCTFRNETSRPMRSNSAR